MELCQLCKHLDCDEQGHFICGLDDEVLQHEAEDKGCKNFEEYIKECE